MTDNFHLWGKPICLGLGQSENIHDNTLDYFILHNKMLGKQCDWIIIN